ncbi:MAG: hypothetical protein O2946_11385, partial [Planctomycetota bacterium]|nr:hypothetical protein [Planctomycetota bacterium]
MDALTERTIPRLCERLEVFRLRGPIPALMAEFRTGVLPEETAPLENFVGTLKDSPANGTFATDSGLTDCS